MTTKAYPTDLRLAALICGTVGLYDVLSLSTAAIGGPPIGYSIDLLFKDFFVFHAAAVAFFQGKLAVVYNTAAITQLQNALYAGRLPYELGFRPFLYPPLWLLDLLPFGLLPLGWAIGTFLAQTAALCAGMLRTLGLPWNAILAILVSPAALWVVIAGQNTFLSVALLYGGLSLLERQPVRAGVLLGLLAYKPQIWLLVPVALLAARAWRPLITMAVTVTALCLVTLLIFGPDFWLAFIAAGRHASTGAAALEMYARVYTHMTSLLAAAKILGLPDGQAMALQLAGAGLAVAVVIWAFACRPSNHARTALLVSAAFLVSPYTLNYDLLLLMPAAAMLFLEPPASGYRPAERIVYLALWLIPGFCMVLNYAGVPVTPLIILLFGGVAMSRLHASPKVDLPVVASRRRDGARSQTTSRGATGP
jgi:hypothetical protein